MVDIIIMAVLLLIIAGAGIYIYKAKKGGQTCIGCPHAKNCAGRCGDSSQKTAEK